MNKSVKETISFKDAMDNLAALSSIDLDAPGPLGIIPKNRIVLEPGEFPESSVQWLSGEGSEMLLEILDSTFRAIHDHLIRKGEDPSFDWENEKNLRGIASIVTLAAESIEKLQRYLEDRLGKPVEPIAERQEYKSLLEFYRRRFLERLQEEAPHVVEETELKDIEVVRSDLDYELFYIRQEDGKVYFDTNLLRHMRLISDFESEADDFEEDPLLQVRSMLDRDAQASASQILGECRDGIADMYKFYRRVAAQDFAAYLSQACMALFLAANPRNLLQNTGGKTSLEYFEDFIYFLRSSMKASEYQKWIAYPPEKDDKMAHVLLNLAHSLSYAFFHRRGGVKQEAIGLIHRTERKGEAQKKTLGKNVSSIWAQLMVEDEHYRSRLAKFPSGPLLKILDLIRSEETEPIPFDPIAQTNWPQKLFTVSFQNREVEFLHLASPTRQQQINKAEILDEIRGLLRFYKSTNPVQKHLMINLQDRTSWKEFARCNALESLQKNAEFSGSLFVITLPKHTDFYSQSSDYLNLHRAEEFMKVFLEQLSTPEECGYFFPPILKTNEWKSFAESIVPMIHRFYFEGKNTLTRQNREDFIEIFYQFLVLKLIEQLQPTSISFTCKDAIDTGAAQTALFYAFSRLFAEGLDARENLDYFRWLLYAPSLFVRERATDPARVQRALSALERLDAGLVEHEKGIVQEIGKLYRSGLKGFVVKN